MKHPHKKERAWFDQAKTAIEIKFKVKFPDNKKHSLYRIVDYIFNNTFNQRMRKRYAAECWGSMVQADLS